MSTPEGVLRAELYMRVLPHRGMPPRGSFEDRVAQEMLLRERRRAVATEVYQAQLVAAGLRINEGLFEMWTLLYIDEISQENYQPGVNKEKRRMLDVFSNQRRVEKKLIERTDSYSIHNTRDMQPYSKAELEVIRDKMRRKVLRDAQSQE